MEFKARIMDEAQLNRTVSRITHEIIERHHGADGICLLGIKRRGIPLCEMLAANIARFENARVPVGHIDISCYRDDLTEKSPMPTTTGCFIPCDVRDYSVVLVDDVIFTGRTARAAIEAVFSHGRPKAISLAVLIDRGHRELPIRPDFVGKNLPTARNEIVRVEIKPIDGETGVSLYGL